MTKVEMTKDVLFVAHRMASKGGTPNRLTLWANSSLGSRARLLYSARESENIKPVIGSLSCAMECVCLPRANGLLSTLKKFNSLANYFDEARCIVPIGTMSEVWVLLKTIGLRSSPKVVVYRAGAPVPVKHTNRARGSILLYTLKILYRRVHKFIVISESLKSLLTNVYGIKPDQISVIPISVEVIEPITPYQNRPGTESGLIKFVTLSRLTREKGVQDVIEAFVKMLKHESGSQTDRVTLEIYGDGEYEAELKRLVDENNVQNQIVFKGWTEDSVSVLREADCLVLASQYEGTPRSILEAGGVCVPTIASNVGGVSELITHDESGWLFDYGNVNELCTLMSDVVNSPALLYQKGIAMNSFVRSRYSKAREISALCEAFDV